MADKRQFKRRTLIFDLLVTDRTTGHRVGRVIDISPEGFMIQSKNPFEKNTIEQFSINLPGEIFQKEVLDLDAKNMWSEVNDKGNLYNSGFLLVDPSAGIIETIVTLIAKYNLND